MHLVALLGDHHHHAERRPTAGDLLLEVVRAALLRLVGIQRPLAGLGLEAVAHPALGALGVGPAERVDRVVGDGGVALGGSAERRLDRGQRLGVRGRNAPTFSMLGCPVSGSGLRACVNSRKSSGVRTKKRGSESPTTSGGSRPGGRTSPPTRGPPLPVGRARVSAAVGEPGGDRHRIPGHVSGGGQPRVRGRERAGHERALRVRHTRSVVSGARDGVDGVHDLLREGVHGRSLMVASAQRDSASERTTAS